MKYIEFPDVTIVSEGKFPIHHTYKSSGYKNVYMSNNISALCLRGLESNGIEKQLISAYINVNIPTISESCFANCINMTAINANNNIKSVGDYGFYNCKSLKYLNFLGNENLNLVHTGDYAFAKSGLTSITLNLKSSVSDTSHGSYTFYGCTDLVEANLEGAPYLASHMFDGCTSLSKVTINDKHSYVNSYCFANCTSLESIEFPANCYMLASHMFDGCTNLKNITFPDDSILKQLEDHVFANCPKLTSLTLPKSIDALSTIDGEFLAGSNIQKITFLGLDDEVFANEVRITTVDFAVNKWYESQSDINTYYNICISKHIPFFWYLSGGSSCGHCTKWKSIKDSDDFKEWVSKDCNIALFSGSQLNSDTTGYSAVKTIWSKMASSLSEEQKKEYVANSDGSYMYVIAGFYWNKLNDDGTETIYGYLGTTFESRCKDISTFKTKVKELFTDNGWSGGSSTVIQIKEEITTFGKGEGLSVTYVSSTGKEYICGNDSIVKSPEYRVDKYTTSDFKYGIWYYNIKELHAFADETHIPIVAEWSHAGCDPCIDFKKNTWKNKTFQEEIKKKPCLFSRIECESYESWDSPVNSQRYYMSHTFGDSKVLIPQFVFYWNKDGTNVIKQTWNYNYRTDSANANYQTVLNKIDSFIAGYTKDSTYSPPVTYTSTNNKFKYYQNEDNDTHGKYFICDYKNAINSFSDCKLSIDISDGTTMPEASDASDSTGSDITILDSIEVNQQVTIPEYTYQYFNVESSDAFTDRKGIIFKVQTVESIRKIIYIYEFENYEQSEEIIKDDEKYKTGQIISLDQETSYDSFNSIVEYAVDNPTKLLVIFKLNSNDDSSNFMTNVLQSSKFKRWIKTSSYLFLKIQSETWTSNAPKALEDFESNVSFNDSTTSIPKILVFRGCSSCIIGEGYAIECRKTILINSSNTIEYYMNLIDEYSTYCE